MYMKIVKQLTINWQELRQFSIARWPEEMGTTHGGLQSLERCSMLMV